MEDRGAAAQQTFTEAEVRALLDEQAADHRKEMAARQERYTRTLERILEDLRDFLHGMKGL